MAIAFVKGRDYVVLRLKYLDCPDHWLSLDVLQGVCAFGQLALVGIPFQRASQATHDGQGLEGT